MRKWLPLVVACLLTMCAMTNCSRQSESIQANPGNLQPTVDLTVLDFGTINSLSPAAGTITVSNPNDKDLLIKEIKPHCRCTTPKLTSNIVPARGTVSIDVSYNPAGRSGPQADGVTILWSTPEINPISITVKADIQRSLVLSKDFIHFESGRNDNSGTKECDISSLDGSEFQVELVSCPSVIDCALAPVSPGQWRTTFSIKPGVDLDVGNIREMVVLTSTDPITKKIHIPITIDTMPTIFADPGIATLRVSRDSRDTIITVRRHDSAPFSIVTATCDSDKLEVSFEANKVQSHHVLQVHAQASIGTDRPLRATISVTGDPANHEILNIPIVCMAAPSS